MILSKLNIEKIDLDNVINQKIKDGILNEVLFIVPTNRKSRYLLRELIALSPGKSSEKINIETLGSFSTELFSAFSGSGELVEDQTMVILLGQAFKKTKLRYFSQYKDGIPFGTLERVKNVISEYKRRGISPDKIKAEAENLQGSEKLKAEDIANIFLEYQKLLTQLNLMEMGDIYSILNQLSPERFEETFRSVYHEINLVYIYGFDEFTSLEIEIIDSTSEIKNSDLYVSFDYYKYNPAVFSHLDGCSESLLQKGFKEVADLSVPVQSKFLQKIRNDLFKSETRPINSHFKEKIIKISASHRGDEVGLIAKEIKSLISNDGVNPSQICVVFNLINNYSPVVRDRFNLLEIPYNLTDRISLSTSQPVTAIINFLEILENDFYYKNIFRALNSYFINLEGLNLSNLLKVSVKLKIVSGLGNWKNRLEDSILELKLNPDADDFDWTDSYKKALSDINKIESHLESFKKQMNPSEFYNALMKSIHELEVVLRILKGSNDVVEKDLKAFSTFTKNLKNLTDLLTLEFGTNKKFSLRYFINQLKTSASFTRYNVQEKPGYGVLVTNLNEIRGLQFDYLFIGGLNDGDLPTRYNPEIFFSGSFITGELRHQTEERYHFYQSLCSWSKRIYLTNSIADDKKDLVESGFLTEMTSQFDIRTKTKTDYADTIYSRPELVTYIGEQIALGNNNFMMPDEYEIKIDELKQAIEINNRRINEPFGESEYSGNLGEDISDDLKQHLHSLSEKQFSVTQLETYAKCPYKYFAERILNLEIVEEPSEELEAFELGSLLHKILYEFYSKLKTERLILQGSSENDFNKAKKYLFEIAENKFRELQLVSPLSFFEKEKILGINGDKKNSILYKFLELERNSVGGLIPEFFEVAFGKIKGDKTGESSRKDFKAGNVNVRGKIDRVEIDSGLNLIKVVDYKTGGKKPSLADLQHGLSLQLPLYLFAAKELISAQLEKDFSPAGMEIYSLKFNENEFGKSSVGIGTKGKEDEQKKLQKSIEASEELIKICIEAINKYVDMISRGIFHLSKLEDRESKVCRFCNFRSVCRIQEVD